MSNKPDKKTLKAIEELVKGNNIAIEAYDSSAEEIGDKKLRKQYATFRSQAARRRDELISLYEDLGGDTESLDKHSPFEAVAGLSSKLRGQKSDYSSLEGRLRGEAMGIKSYIDKLPEVSDDVADTLAKHIRAEQDNVEWLRNYGKQGEKKGGGGFSPLLIVLALVGALLFYLLRDEEEDDDDDILNEDYLTPVNPSLSSSCR